ACRDAKYRLNVLVRPSYVLGGRAMEIVHHTVELLTYMKNAAQVSPQHPVLIDKYIHGKEVEIDGIGDGRDIFIPGIMEHIERAGVHSGDSMAVYPPQTLRPEEIKKVVEYTLAIGRALKIRGLLNIQYAVAKDGIYVLEVNPRASRTVPVLSKVTGVPMVQVATRAIMGHSLAAMGYAPGLEPAPKHITVKAPVFSFEKLSEVEISLGPEMKSTGEVMGVDFSFPNALYKAMLAAGWDMAVRYHIINARLVSDEYRGEKRTTNPRKASNIANIPGGGKIRPAVLISLADRDKMEALFVIKRYGALGFRLYATGGTAKALSTTGLAVEEVKDAPELIRSGKVQLVINTPTRGKLPARAGFKLRRTAAEYRVPCLTSLDTALALADVLDNISRGAEPKPVKMTHIQEISNRSFHAS
ncbi:MAG: ATP-grasp domain-containing protein, partial [Firmicutes bacterium]|nr:ATP-grasp domain-containing protein [Bacillota bacterium]